MGTLENHLYSVLLAHLSTPDGCLNLWLMSNNPGSCYYLSTNQTLPEFPQVTHSSWEYVVWLCPFPVILMEDSQKTEEPTVMCYFGNYSFKSKFFKITALHMWWEKIKKQKTFSERFILSLKLWKKIGREKWSHNSRSPWSHQAFHSDVSIHRAAESLISRGCF